MTTYSPTRTNPYLSKRHYMSDDNKRRYEEYLRRKAFAAFTGETPRLQVIDGKRL